jgi:hypothetical protein
LPIDAARENDCFRFSRHLDLDAPDHPLAPRVSLSRLEEFHEIWISSMHFALFLHYLHARVIITRDSNSDLRSGDPSRYLA